MAVNGVSTVNVTHKQAVEALKAAGGIVTLVIIQFFFQSNLRKGGSSHCLVKVDV